MKSIEEIVRTLFIDLKQWCGEELSVHDSFFPWLLEHACDLLNRFKVRKGNKTGWEYLTREPYTGEIYQFGTPCDAQDFRSRARGSCCRKMV